jgi:hypothetical protein
MMESRSTLKAYLLERGHLFKRPKESPSQLLPLPSIADGDPAHWSWEIGQISMTWRFYISIKPQTMRGQCPSFIPKHLSKKATVFPWPGMASQALGLSTTQGFYVLFWSVLPI